MFWIGVVSMFLVVGLSPWFPPWLVSWCKGYRYVAIEEVCSYLTKAGPLAKQKKERESVCVCLQSPSNPSFYRQIIGYGMSVDDHRIAWWWKGVMDKQIGYLTLIGVHSTMLLMHPN